MSCVPKCFLILPTSARYSPRHEAPCIVDREEGMREGFQSFYSVSHIILLILQTAPNPWLYMNQEKSQIHFFSLASRHSSWTSLSLCCRKSDLYLNAASVRGASLWYLNAASACVDLCGTWIQHRCVMHLSGTWTQHRRVWISVVPERSIVCVCGSLVFSG